MFAASRDPTRIDECLFASRSDHAVATRSIVSLCGNTECGVTINTPVACNVGSITCPKCNTNTELDSLFKGRGKYAAKKNGKKKSQEVKIPDYFKKP